MTYQNQVQPEPEQIKEFLATEGPVLMVNLLKFRAKAAYPDGRDPELSGQEAYARYATEMQKLVEARGGRFVFMARVRGLLLGKVDPLWDHIGIVEYPSAKSMLEIASTPEFHAIEVHRLAGLEGQLNLTCSEAGLD